MTISNREELLDAVKEWSRREDISEFLYDDFVRLAEADIEARVRTHEMTSRVVTGTIAGQFRYVQPSGALGIRNIEVTANGMRYPLEYHTPEALDAKFGAARSGVPLGYTLSGTEIEVQPCPNAAYQMRIIYYEPIPKLSIDVTTSWVLTKYPQAYLWGTLHHLANFIRDDEGAKDWGDKFAASVEAIADADLVDRWSGSAPSVKVV